jgi:peptidoglycan/xylan/chitin deacetylase (PgdA/CDA1 family)
MVATRRELLLGVGSGMAGAALGAGSAAAAVGLGWREESAQDARTRETAGAAAPHGRPVRVGARRVIWSTTPAGPYAAITFDDGPTPRFTPRILDALAAAGVRATFDVIGYNAVRHADLLHEIVAQGHEIGNHTWSHLDHTTIDAARIRTEIERCRDEVEHLIQQPLAGFRPPRGELTGCGLLVAAELGYDVFLWSVTGGRKGISTQQVAEDYLASVVQVGDIVCLHDGLGRGTFSPDASFARELAARREVEVAALPGALRRIADRGIRLTTATDLVARSAPVI